MLLAGLRKMPARCEVAIFWLLRFFCTLMHMLVGMRCYRDFINATQIRISNFSLLRFFCILVHVLVRICYPREFSKCQQGTIRWERLENHWKSCCVHGRNFHQFCVQALARLSGNVWWPIAQFHMYDTCLSYAVRWDRPENQESPNVHMHWTLANFS